METIQLNNLSNLCRICLMKTDTMSNLFDSSNGLYDMLTVITNIQVDKTAALPNYICINCKDTILACQAFISKFKQTNELLEKYKQCNFKLVEGVGNKVDSGSISMTEIQEFVPDNDSNSIKEDNWDDDQDITGWKPRLKQFSHDSVMEAIEALKKKISDVQMCSQCNFEAKNYRALSIHVAFSHKDFKDKWCTTCNKIVGNSQTHCRFHKQENSCRFCGKIFSSHGHLMEHLMGHTLIRPYKCDSCDKAFVSPRHLRVHYRTHTNEKLYVCHICGWSFTQLQSLKKHRQKHYYKSNVSDLTCIWCKQSLETVQSLQEHQCLKVPPHSKIITTKQNYCTMCRKNVRSLKTHNENHHGENKQEAKQCLKLCTVCGKQFKNGSKLKIHMRIHTGETPYGCSYCDRKMATRNHLVAHERVHTGLKPYDCNICSKAFTQRSNLNTHMRLHTGRPESCLICGKRFCRQTDLGLHMKRHTGEKPFICSYCGKAFIQKSHLVEHTRAHSDDKPFKCIHCGRDFRRRFSLKTHVQIHLGEKPFKCTQCPYACRQRYNLTLHMKRHKVHTPQPDG